MERWEMLNEYNRLVSKRTSYNEKQRIISSLREDIEERMKMCIGYSQEIEIHYGQSNYFDLLSEDNRDIFSTLDKERLLGELDDLASYMTLEIQSIQSDINYWDRKIKDYDETHGN